MNRWLVIASVGALGAVAWPMATASACTCEPQQGLLKPGDGATPPANAALLFEVSCGGSIGPFEAVVDGQPATLTAVDPPFEGPVRATLEPSPAPGQEVVVMQCDDAVEFGGECPEDSAETEIARYVVAEIDVTAPPAAGSGELTHEEGEFELGCSVFDVRFAAVVEGLEQGDEADIIYTIELQAPDGTIEGAHVEHVDTPTPELHAEFLRAHEMLEASPEDHCLVVRAADLAGNETEISRRCGSRGVEGCGCRTDVSDPRGWALLLLALGLLRRRRQRRVCAASHARTVLRSRASAPTALA